METDPRKWISQSCLRTGEANSKLACREVRLGRGRVGVRDDGYDAFAYCGRCGEYCSRDISLKVSIKRFQR